MDLLYHLNFNLYKKIGKIFINLKLFIFYYKNVCVYVKCVKNKAYFLLLYLFVITWNSGAPF